MQSINLVRGRALELENQGISCSRPCSCLSLSSPESSCCSCSSISCSQPGWVKSPVARTSRPLTPAQAARFLRLSCLLVALE